jgi:hypothetical protein
MTAQVQIPVGMLAYSRRYDLNPAAVAQNTLDEMARDFGELMMRGVDPRADDGGATAAAPTGNN